MKHPIIKKPNTINTWGMWFYSIITLGIFPYLYVYKKKQYFRKILESINKFETKNYYDKYVNFYLFSVFSSFALNVLTNLPRHTAISLIILAICIFISIAFAILQVIYLNKTLNYLCDKLEEANISYTSRPNVLYAFLFGSFYLHNYLREIDLIFDNLDKEEDKEIDNQDEVKNDKNIS